MAIFDRAKQLRLRRYLRRRRRFVEDSIDRIDDSFEHNVLNRVQSVSGVWRFITAWGLLVVLLSGLTLTQTYSLSHLYQKELPAPGGVFDEGIIGSFSNANPIYASSAVDNAVSRLVFAGLMKYDTDNQLVGDLAEKLEIDQNSRNYTVYLKKGLQWHDGAPLTADDVVFTYQTIQNPDSQSSLRASWQGVTITKVNDLTVRFTLASPLAPFKYGLTLGIIPKHLLVQIPASQLRSSDFNTNQPIGAGPYVWTGLDLKDPAADDSETSVIALHPFSKYHPYVPKLDRFLIHTYNNEKTLADAFANHEVSAAAGLRTKPKSLNPSEKIQTYSFKSSAEILTFFKTSEGVLSDIKVRKALALATARNEIARAVPNAYRPVRSPLLPGQVGYDKQYDQPVFNLAEASKVLDEAGWKLEKGTVRVKEGKKLLVRLYAEDTPDNRSVVRILQRNWLAVGVEVKAELQEASSFQTTINFHTYDALLYGISIGADPDVYAYWHSSQADVRSSARLNFSEYKSEVADKSLEAGRTRDDPVVRTLKYQPFLKAWSEDTPAVALYQPRTFYYSRGPIYHLKEATINIDADRYNNVANWEIHTAGTTQ